MTDTKITNVIKLVDSEKGITPHTLESFFVDCVCDLKNNDDYEIPAKKVWQRWLRQQKRRDFLKGAIYVLRARGVSVEEAKNEAKTAYSTMIEKRKNEKLVH